LADQYLFSQLPLVTLSLFPSLIKLLFMSLITTLAAVIAMIFTAVAMVFDLKVRRIPNALTVSAFFAGIGFHAITAGWSGLGFALLGFVAGFCPLLLLWLIGGGGGGDVKLMGALGTWLGGPVTLVIFIGSAVTAIVWLVVARFGRALGSDRDVTEGQCDDSTVNVKNASPTMLPYAIPVAITTWAWMLLKFAVEVS
jgi:prepilin peptidase CpaA